MASFISYHCLNRKSFECTSTGISILGLVSVMQRYYPYLLRTEEKTPVAVHGNVFLPIVYWLPVVESRTTMDMCMNGSILRLARLIAGVWDCTHIVCVFEGWLSVVGVDFPTMIKLDDSSVYTFPDTTKSGRVLYTRSDPIYHKWQCTPGTDPGVNDSELRAKGTRRVGAGGWGEWGKIPPHFIAIYLAAVQKCTTEVQCYKPACGFSLYGFQGIPCVCVFCASLFLWITELLSHHQGLKWCIWSLDCWLGFCYMDRLCVCFLWFVCARGCELWNGRLRKHTSSFQGSWLYITKLHCVIFGWCS